MNARDAILRSLRSRELVAPPLPELSVDCVRYPDPVAQFIGAVERAAGRVVRTKQGETVQDVLHGLIAPLEPRVVCSLVPEWSNGVPLGGAPQSFEHVNLLLIRAEFGVAENGAVWFSDATLPQRSLLFLAEHVIVLASVDELVHTMHEAYERLKVAERPFGCFVSGPSKTADIEQALVVGAHGPRSLSIVLE